MNRAILGGVCALAAGASVASGQLYSEGMSGDLPNIPAAAPTVLTPSFGVTYLARGINPTSVVDIDFITVIVPFPTQRLLFDVDHLNTPLEDGVMGVGPIGQYPLPTWVNDDDNNVPDDAICGHAAAARDSLLDIGALLGIPPIIAPDVYTIALGRTGEQFVGWNGTANLPLKLEWNLYVYAEPVPGPGVAVVLGAAGLLAGVRRRR